MPKTTQANNLPKTVVDSAASKNMWTLAAEFNKESKALNGQVTSVRREKVDSYLRVGIL